MALTELSLIAHMTERELHQHLHPRKRTMLRQYLPLDPRAV
jgi:hypothetical protein